MSNYVDLTESAFQNVATSCASTRVNFPRAGNYHSGIEEKLKTVSYFFSDGAPEAQRDARLVLGSMPGDKILHVDRDWLHELWIAVRGPVQTEPPLQDIRASHTSQKCHISTEDETEMAGNATSALEARASKLPTGHRPL